MGARWRETPAQVTSDSDISFSIVGFPQDVREVFLGFDGALEGADEGDLLVDMTMSEPQLAIEMHETASRTGPGTGQHTKMENQILIASRMIGVSETLLYAQEAGLDMEKAFRAVSGGAAGSWSLSNYGPRMLRGDFAPGFFVDFIKDMGIALYEAATMKVGVPGLALAHQLYVALQTQGGGHRGTRALLEALARSSNIEWKGDTEVI